MENLNTNLLLAEGTANWLMVLHQPYSIFKGMEFPKIKITRPHSGNPARKDITIITEQGSSFIAAALTCSVKDLPSRLRWWLDHNLSSTVSQIAQRNRTAADRARAAEEQQAASRDNIASTGVTEWVPAINCCAGCGMTGFNYGYVPAGTTTFALCEHCIVLANQSGRTL